MAVRVDLRKVGKELRLVAIDLNRDGSLPREDEDALGTASDFLR
jgi:hypothetical protein